LEPMPPVRYIALDHMLLDWIQQTPLSTAIRRSDWAVMGLESVHLLGLALLGGSTTLIALAALRRGGLRGLSVPTFVRGLMPLLIIGLVLMVISGSLIAQSMPYRYYLNTAFRIKMLLLIAAIATTAWLSRSAASRSIIAHRMLALLSFLLWLSVGVSGRLIGFL
jgi:hypothetical protein